MAATTLRREEGIGLGVALALHAAVLAALLFSPRDNDVVRPPERIEVTISDESALTSTAPDPNGAPAPDTGPQQGEPAPAPAPMPEVEPAPAPLPEPRPAPEPAPVPAPRAVEKPQPRPAPRPVPKAPPKPVVKAQPRPTPPKPTPPKPAARPAEPRKASPIDSIVKKQAPQKTATKPATKGDTGKTASSTPGKSTTPAKKPGSSRFDDAFKTGTPGGKSPAESGTPAAQIGPQVRSALNAAIGRQLKPHWRGKAPEGADAELLVTKVRFRLNRDGSLAGEPQALSTTGQTDANRAQVSRHQEQAVRAVKLAAPFDLPDDLYEGWKVVTTNFDRRLSQ